MFSSGEAIWRPEQHEYEVGCFQNQVLPPAGDALPEILYAFMATSTPDHIYFGWHVVQTRLRKKKVAAKARVDAAGSSDAIDLPEERTQQATGGKKRRMDRWEEKPQNMEATTPSGGQSKLQIYYDWAFARGAFVLMIGRWWWFLSAAAWHALLRAAPLGVDAVDVIVELECHSSRYGACLFSSESWRMDENLTPWSLPPGYDVDTQCVTAAVPLAK